MPPLPISRILSLLLLTVFLNACRHPAAPEVRPARAVAEEAAAEEPPPVPPTPMNDIARYLAGMPGGRGDSPLDAYRSAPGWQQYRRRMDELWSRFSLSRLPRISAFSRSELQGLREAPVLWYPFSGPDILFAESFFPAAAHYELCGLESCEMLPDLTVLPLEQHQAILDGLYTSLTTSLSFSYFITRDMRVDLQRTQARGTLPVILVFLARLGCSVESVEPLRLDGAGRAGAGLGAGNGAGFLVRYRHGFRDGKTLCYFTANAADSTLRGDRRYLEYIRSRSPAVTYLKSASYLLHTGEFTLIRRGILDLSTAILQDDSGLPLRVLQQERNWDLTFYGAYTGVLDIFREYEQPDLATVYQMGAGDVRSIDFGLGYKYETGQSALILARRR